MSILPIDIVLLPDNTSSEYLCSINHSLWWKYTLWVKNNVPHVSIFKWCFDSQFLPEISEYISLLSKTMSVMKLIPTHYRSWNETAWKTSHLYFSNNSTIDTLRMEINQKYRGKASYDVSLTSFPEPINTLSKQRITLYPSTLDKKTYKTHCSLWFWDIDQNKFPLPESIILDKIAIVVMWNRLRSNEILEIFYLKKLK